MKLIYIHGATASNRSFGYLVEKLNHSNHEHFEYDSKNPFKDNLKIMQERLDSIDEKVFIVAHSLGGIYTVHLSEHNQDKILGVVSLATPFGGSDMALWAGMLNPSYRLFSDITPNSWPIKQSKKIKIQMPWTQVVTTVGDVPWLLERNDGVVTFASMTCRDDVKLVEIDRNHYEIVQSIRVYQLIKDRINQL